MNLTIRDLDPHEFERFGEIDRSERINAQYVFEAGGLRLQPVDIDVAGWAPGAVASHVEGLHELHAAGGSVLGAFEGARLVGVGGLDVRPVESMPDVFKLEPLHVSAAHRGQGVGKRLTFELARRAAGLGASGLYISATPTRNTVDAYLRMGAEVLARADPKLLGLEPEDIHLLLPVRPGGAG